MKGNPKNICEEYMGTICTNQSTVFVKAESINSGRKCRIYLFQGERTKHCKNDISDISEQLSDLKDKSIVHIYPNGKIHKICDIDSNDTTLLFTEKCNQNCVFCAQPDRNKEDEGYLQKVNILTTKLLIRNKAPFIGISGGEPTLKLNELIQTVKSINKSSTQTTIEILTNATLFEDEECVKAFRDAQCRNISFHIPLYSDSENIHNSIVQKNNFYKTMKGIYNLAKYKYPIEIRNVVSKLNYIRLRQWAEIITNNFPFVYHVAIMGLEPVGNAIKNINSVWVEQAETVDLIADSISVLTRKNIKASVYNYPLCILPEYLWSYYAPAISGWKQTYLPQCQDCSKKNICCGVFNSQKLYHSKMIKAIGV